MGHDDEGGLVAVDLSVMEADPRVDWMGRIVCASTKARDDKWKKMIQMDDNRIVITSFLDLQMAPSILFYFNSKDDIVACTTDQPSSFKKKSVYFIRNSIEKPVPMDKIPNQLKYGDMGQNPLEQLSTLVDEIYLNLLTNPKNNVNWPAVVTQDVLRHFYKLKSNVHVVAGQVKGKTLLPLPPGAATVTEADKQIVHALETAVIDWSHQIKNVIKSNSATPILAGLNPGPMVEVDFWAAKAANLQYIYDQLRDTKIKKIAAVLEKTKSSYYPAFKRIFEEVVGALEEANDINTYLKSLRPYAEKLGDLEEFRHMTSVVSPMVHTITLIWQNSKYFNTPSRVIVLLQEICNDIITAARTFVEPADIFKLEAEDAKSRVSTVLGVLEEFQACFFYAKQKIKDLSEAEGSTCKPWNFDHKLVFERLDLFTARLTKLLTLFRTVLEFLKLEKIEIGGVQGKLLSKEVQEIYTEFQAGLQIFGMRTYDSLDPLNQQFEEDFSRFQIRIQALDNRLGTVICKAFDDCSSVTIAFKLLDSFAGLLEREIIQKDIEHKFAVLIANYDADLAMVKGIYDVEKDAPPLHRNVPPVAGALSWCIELKHRIQTPMERLQAIKHSTMTSEEARLLSQKYEEMMELLNAYSASTFDKWAENIEEVSKINLEQTLLARDEVAKYLSVNFSPALKALLREVRYLESLKLEIPVTASSIFEKNETFHGFIGSLDLIVSQYNGILSSLLDVERPLVREKLEKIDTMLEQGLAVLNWESTGVMDYIKDTREVVENLANRLSRAKSNIIAIEKIMSLWDKPLFERKDGKKILDVEGSDKLHVRYDDIVAGGENIHKLIADNKLALEAEGKPEDWEKYVSYVDDLVLRGFAQVVRTSLSYIIQHMDPTFLRKHELGPLMEARVELVVPTIIFTPEMDLNSMSGFVLIIHEMLDNIYKTATLVNRLNKSNEDYYDQVCEIEELSELKEQLLVHTDAVIKACNTYEDSLHKWAYLWEQNRSDYMESFLRYGRLLSAEEIEMSVEGPPESPPTLTNYDTEIASYERIHGEIMQMKDINIFNTWFRVDSNPFKQSLSVVVKKWSYMFTQHLQQRVVESLKELETFVVETERGLSVQMEEGDYEVLVDAMGRLQAVRHRTQETDNMFDPLHQTIKLLAVYDIEMPEDVYHQLQKLPEEWVKVKKLAYNVKLAVAPLQANEVAVLRKKCDQFQFTTHEFRESFRSKAPFQYSVGLDAAYDVLDATVADVAEMELDATQLGESAGLFEVTIPDYRPLKDCRRECINLKHVWDTVALVHSTFDEWMLLLWEKIDPDVMESDSKKFVKSMRNLDKEVRAWDVYNGLDKYVKNMVVSLRSVGELRNPAIRDRHWHAVTKLTGVKFTLTDATRLSDLLELSLHNFEDDVRGIVDRATKELSMEKILNELETTWAGMDFIFDIHDRTNIPLLQSSEELVDTLEDNQVTLQNLMTSRYVDHFLDQITCWQSKLATVDSVMNIWLEVQHTWNHLENIFIGSADIRAQLPEDSKRFDGIDADFKELMKDASKTPNVAEACCKPGLFEKLEDIQLRLTLCEKSLAEYLETKRLAFPRFYFISSNDLLDILAKGNSPSEVTVHLAKLFDNIARIEFLKNNGDPTKTALGMYSKENEYVVFAKDCECTGAVEQWLNRLVDTMRGTLHHLLGESIVTYEEKPREQWLFDYCAQVCLTASQIWWTTEVNIAFGRLEEGYENALKEYYKKQVAQLHALITMIQGSLSKNDRQKIMVLCTIDVHARDIVTKLIRDKEETSGCFSWQSQLRTRWDEEKNDCFNNICDAVFRYNYEYLGNTGRLVITPLTDRCYITLTQSLHLIMGGAPAGPAGTGKTETTKDLGRALGMMVYVFNCSEQMDYKSVGNIYKGLAQSGSWGCFDEFNRIAIEVLSVVATQVKSILDAIAAKKKRFIFQGEEINLIPTCGIWITMNPGYAGRTELPENIKALFRPCSMVVPDLELICEIMLMAEGFVEAKLLARKFVTLYKLNSELLSKQDHYDWGLRAIKSVLVVAGGLKRAEPKVPEEHVLMRALRDFNLPKIVSDDVMVFMGLINDLFPKTEILRKRNPQLESHIRRAMTELQLQVEDSFVLKVVQLNELLEVRHSVFIIGPAGSGKTQIWKSLARSFTNQGQKCVIADLNPKVVENAELYGFINPATREWKDGLFSCLMRDMANLPGENPKWLVFDGDIDTMWIESLNTVMDDNKVLTLASNERIALIPSMRLLFEIGHLKYASPATVSRAGILYVNPSDLGWGPYVTSWIETREHASEKGYLTVLFEKYIPSCLDKCRSNFKKIVPISEMSYIQTLCFILDGLLTVQNTPPGCDKEVYETYFVFAAVWAFGGPTFQDQLVDHRVEFSKWWVSEFRTIKFPSQGTVFDYFVDTETKKFLHWNDRVPEYHHDPDQPLQAVLVHTTETIRLRYMIDLLADHRRPVMLVGNAGCGKTVLVQNKLSDLSEDRMVVNSSFNNYTTSLMLQEVLEAPLEKKAGRNFGPPGNKKLIYFIDDFNMPAVDLYGTQQPHTLLRQHLDYNHWYDRAKLTLKEIHNCQYVACMNPTAGSFTINPRLQRHFCVFAVCFPNLDSLTLMYQSILSGHMASFSPVVVKIIEKLVSAALALHKRVSSVFLPTAIKFHYSFNLRDLSNIFQGLMFSTEKHVQTGSQAIRLWMHEAERVYCDKMISSSDRDSFLQMVNEVIKKEFSDHDQAELQMRPLLLTHFTLGMGDGNYVHIESFDAIKRVLEEALEAYNDTYAAMNLVLFEDAMCHVCRISRMIESPRGNALLVGVGGSGKQSLARLAAFISSYEVFQISLRKGYSVNDLRSDLAVQYCKAGVKGEGVVFMMTDSQIADEQFLVVINDYLAAGIVPGLMPDDEMESCLNSVRSEAKGLGIIDTRENLYSYFVKKVREKLKIVLCFSPVGDQFRNRARRFPAVINCTMIDWFHEWPEGALISVSRRFLEDTELIAEDLKPSVSTFMAYVHKSVNESSEKYLLSERRYNYTTPKTFLELITLYKNLLETKASELTLKMERLENGLAKLESTASQVDDLKSKLAAQEVLLGRKNAEADELLQKVAVDQEKVNKEKKIAQGEEEKVAIITQEVAEKQASCEKDLAAAEPALAAAQDALNTLNKTNLTELKSFGSPPEAVKSVCAAVMILLAPPNKIPKDRSWKAAKVMMGKVDAFLDSLVNFDKENIADATLTALKPYLKDPEFNYDFIAAKSLAAAGLCAWVINIVTFYEVFCDVEPKRAALKQANETLESSQQKLQTIQAKIEDLDRNLGELKASFQNATDEKLRCEQEAQSTQKTILLANRLVNGLASEKIRWAESVGRFKEEEKTLAGDVLLASSFISYVGCFSKFYREELLYQKWLPFITDGMEVPIPLTPNADPLLVLTDDAQIASWNNEGLPNDRVSLENAATLVSAQRWPLLIDPQLQGVEWIKNREGSALRIVRLGARGYLDTIEKAVTNGDTVLLEAIGEQLDPVLDPLIGRNTIKKGRYIKLGDKEIEFHKSFRLILQTKMGNPHYPPEIQAQTTLINFTVTQEGLEDQLLASVVSRERPDLEAKKAELTKQQNQFKIKLKELEDTLLMRLSAAEGNFLGDTALVENLEVTKRTAAEIEVQVEEAKNTERTINETREKYRPVAERSSLLYFLLNNLHKINPMYQFSLKAFNVVFHKAIGSAEPAEDVTKRTENLIESITYFVFQYTTRGLFERDKLIFTAQMCFQILRKKGDIVPEYLDFLLRAPCVLNVRSPLEWLPMSCWGTVKALSNLDSFRGLASDIEGSGKRWKKLCETECPEKEKFPQEWKNKTLLQKLCMLRALRPDRMTYAVRDFVAEKMGQRYVQSPDITFAMSFEEAGPATPIFFILSPGVDPVKDVESLGRQLGFTGDTNKFHNVSLGQGQEIVAEQKMDLAYKDGAWVMLQNIHLVTKWLPVLEKKLEATSEGSHPDFRVFMSADPPSSADFHVIPNGILQTSIKITNEPPTGMMSNVNRAWSNFTQDTLEICSKENEFKSILFALCYFHAVVLERRKFGPQGWNRPYPFNTGDLIISHNVLFNYLEANSKVPWTDLRYIFGEIMYGGHISDDWDRRLCGTYLEEYMRNEMLEGELELAPGFPAPAPLDYVGYQQYVDTMMPPESPYLYGLHPNAEIGFLTQSAETLFRTILEMQPRDAAGGETITREEKVKQILEEIRERLPENFNVAELIARCEERTPFVTVALQECERMTILLVEIRRSLKELDLGLKGDLTISEAMDALMTNLYLDNVPVTWSSLAYASLFGLAQWYADLLNRHKELEGWVADFALPASVWLSGFFNPQSFLTAIMQTTARKNEWPLDKMVLNCDVTKKIKDDVKSPPREGSYVHGLFMEGARWDTGAGVITDSRLKELHPTMPVIYIKAVTVDKRDTKNVYSCPIYRTRSRGPTFVWILNLKTKEKEAKWILAGVCLLLQV